MEKRRILLLPFFIFVFIFHSIPAFSPGIRDFGGIYTLSQPRYLSKPTI